MSVQRNQIDRIKVEEVVGIFNEDASGKFLFVVEHASNHIPLEYDQLGLDKEALESHIAWDPGALELAVSLLTDLNSALIVPKISRLLYDVNRPFDSPSAVPAMSENRRISGNENLSDEERQRRYDRYYIPFHQAVTEHLDEGDIDAFVTIHSFTPVFNDEKREVEIGILHDTDERLADALLELARRDGSFVVRRNEPYDAKDGVTHTLQKHAVARGLPNVMIEIRNDLLDTEEKREKIRQWLEKLLIESLSVLEGK